MPTTPRLLAAALLAGALSLAGGSAPALAQSVAAEPQARDIDDACPEGTEDSPFTDVPGSHPFNREIGCLLRWGVTRGTSATTYSPDALVTRGQMAAFIARTVLASGGSLPDGEDAFDDDDGSGFEGDIDRLVAAEIVEGTGLRRYSPAEPVDRAEMAAFLVRAYDYRAGQDDAAALTPDGDYFPDDDGWALEQAINTAATAGLTGGHSDGTFRPGEPVRRDHMAAFLTRTLDLAVENGLADVPPDTEPLPGGTLVPCENPDGFTIGRPETWSTNPGDVVPACSQFNPDPFEVRAGTDQRVAAITAYVDPVPFEEAATPDVAQNLDAADTVLDGRQAVRLEYELGERGLWPAGTRVTVYAVELPDADGPRTLFLDTVGLSGFDYDHNQLVLDRMARTLDLGEQGRDDVIAFYGGVADLAVQAQPVGDEVCLSVLGDGEQVCVPEPDQGPLQTALLDDVGPVLAGVTTPEVFRVELDLHDGGTSAVLPAPVAGGRTVAFAVQRDLDAVERFRLLDLTGSVVEVVAPGP